MNEEVLNYIFKKPEKLNYIMSKKKAYIVIILILILLFATIVLLTMTEGILKLEDYAHYAYEHTVTNLPEDTGDSLVWVFVLAYVGVVYTFVGACIISYLSKFIKNIDSRIKFVIRRLPIFTILFSMPAMFIAEYIVEAFNLV